MDTGISTYSIPEQLSAIYEKMEVSPLVVLNNYAKAHIQSKIQKYEAENSLLVNKYGLSFEEFRFKIEKETNVENFSVEEDLLDWQFIIENLRYWKDQLSGLKD
jgi:hypothetical protein